MCLLRKTIEQSLQRKQGRGCVISFDLEWDLEHWGNRQQTGAKFNEFILVPANVSDYNGTGNALLSLCNSLSDPPHHSPNWN
jgi:hypothetical protein